MKDAKFRLIAVEDGRHEEVAEHNDWRRLRNRAVSEIGRLPLIFEGSVTWFVVEVETERIWFHIGTGTPEYL